MSAENFTTLYDLITSGGAGWLDALVQAWQGGCLTEDQKDLLLVAT